MKFYGNDLIWDKENNKPLCKFKDGVYDAKDNREIEILYSLGYEHEELNPAEIEKEQVKEEKPKGKKVKK